MFTLSYYCPFIDFISSTHGTVLLLKNYNGNKTKNALTMVSTDLLITRTKIISTMVVIFSYNPKTILGFLQELECNNNFAMHLYLGMYKQ